VLQLWRRHFSWSSLIYGVIVPSAFTLPINYRHVKSFYLRYLIFWDPSGMAAQASTRKVITPSRKKNRRREKKQAVNDLVDSLPSFKRNQTASSVAYGSPTAPLTVSPP
jgi:hypothetical protein